MARRELQEINAGSMADIAFLLLIFFLVTTTMEVDAGIGRTLPLKRDLPENYVPPEIRERDILEINCNSNDQLLVEGKLIAIEELEEIVLDFYTANKGGVRDENMPFYENVTTTKCQTEIAKIQPLVEENPDEQFYQDELDSWETKLKLCQELPTGQYDEMAKSAVIRFKNQAGTSYGLYIEIQNILKRVVNNLRSEQCEEIWGRDYFTLDQTDEKDQDIIKKLRLLVPERIIEAKIDR
jgi:biopolymer transport protein ExbD